MWPLGTPGQGWGIKGAVVALQDTVPGLGRARPRTAGRGAAMCLLGTTGGQRATPTKLPEARAGGALGGHPGHRNGPLERAGFVQDTQAAG